jgi:hypothetical protein
MATFSLPTNFSSLAIDGSGRVTVGAYLSTLDFTTTMKTSIGTAVAASAVASVTGAVGSVTGLTASDVGAIKAKTDSLTFTVSGKVDANTLYVNGNAEAAVRLDRAARAITKCTVGSASTTTSIVTSACDPAGAVADQFKGLIVAFDKDTTTAALRGQKTDITASSNSTTPTLTVTALTTAPVAGDSFTIE